MGLHSDQESNESGIEPAASGTFEDIVVNVDDLVCGYGTIKIAGPVSFSVKKGEFWLIEGANGAGKSTLMKTLIGLNSPLSGRVDWALPRQNLRFVPQTRTLDPMLPASVYDVLATGLQRGSSWQALRMRLSHDQAVQALHAVGLSDYENHLFRELSEGQKQLVLIARALIGNPDVLLLDEPAASMDPEREETIVGLLSDLQQRLGVTVLMIAHGSRMAQKIANARMQVCRRHGVTIQYQDSECCA